MIVFPNAKINLGLNVVAKRPDGYHNIETVMMPVGWCDILEILPRHEETGEPFSLSTTGRVVGCAMADNLVYRAYKALERHTRRRLNVKVLLHKNIPDGAGLGGGSADASFTLLLLNRIFDLNLPSDTLEKLAGEIGSDCPFFIVNKPVYACGRGEIMTPVDVPLKGMTLMIVKPPMKISTAQAYAGIIPKKPEVPVNIAIQSPVEDWPNLLTNDFEQVAFKMYPELAQLKERFYKAGALYASMSGSGSAFYGIFAQDTDNLAHLKSNVNPNGWPCYFGTL